MHRRATSGHGRRVLPNAAGLLLIFHGAGACHPLRQNSPPAQSTEITTRPVRLRDVTDPTGRWRSRVTTAEQPKIHVLPGHVRLELLPGSSLAAHCFVYDQAILAGEATAQLLHAIAPGLQFNEFSAVDIRALNHTPAVSFSLTFATTLGEKEQGQIDIFVLPRLDHPVMCSIETVVHGEERSTVRQRDDAQQVVEEFLSNLNVTQPRNIEFDEVWLLKRGEATTGFRHVRVEKMGDAYATVMRSSHFSLMPDAIANSDRIDQVLEDEKGLVRMTWLQLTDGRVELRGQVERQEDGYRYGAETRGVVSNGRFTAASPLLGSVHLQNALTKERPEQSGDYYLPDLRVEGPAICELAPPVSTSEHPCMICTAPSAAAAPASAAGLQPTFPKTIQFEVGTALVSYPIEGNASCSTERRLRPSPVEQLVLVATHGTWPRF